MRDIDVAQGRVLVRPLQKSQTEALRANALYFERKRPHLIE